MPFQPRPQTNLALRDVEAILSTERFLRYRIAAQGDLPLAIQIYEANIELSECIFGVLHLVDVCVRNSMHAALARHCGTDRWFDYNVLLPASGKPIPYTAPMQRSLQQAIHGAGGAASSGKVVAELTFGFWTSLLASRFQQPLWNPCLHSAFPHFRGLPRNVHRRLEVIQRLRNRIAHHERVLTSLDRAHTGHIAQPYIGLPEILECAAWASTQAAD